MLVVSIQCVRPAGLLLFDVTFHLDGAEVVLQRAAQWFRCDLIGAVAAQTSVNCLPGPIHRISNLGIFAALAVQTAGPRFESVIPTSEVMARRLREGERIDLAIAPEAIYVIEAAR